MRYGVGSAIDNEVWIEADLDQVWKLVTDIELPARFSPELQRVCWLDDTSGPAVGARFEGHNHHQLLGEWRTLSYVVEWDAPRTFAWAVVDPDGRYGPDPADPQKPLATWRFELEPTDGGIRLRHSVLIGPGQSGLTMIIDRTPEREQEILQYRLAELRAGILETLTGIKSLAEQPEQ